MVLIREAQKCQLQSNIIKQRFGLQFSNLIISESTILCAIFNCAFLFLSLSLASTKVPIINAIYTVTGRGVEYKRLEIIAIIIRDLFHAITIVQLKRLFVLLVLFCFSSCPSSKSICFGAVAYKFGEREGREP